MLIPSAKGFCSLTRHVYVYIHMLWLIFLSKVIFVFVFFLFLGGGGWGKEVYKGWSDSLEILSVGDLPLL